MTNTVTGGESVLQTVLSHIRLNTILGEETFLVPVEWDDKGWPVIGRNGLLDERISSDRKLFDGVMQKSQTDEGETFS